MSTKGKNSALKGLTEKQKKFCEYYIQTSNATKAAEMAGYSKNSAYSIGNENLKKPEIKQYLDEVMAQAQSERVAEATEVLEFLTAVMRADKDKLGVKRAPSVHDRLDAADKLGKKYGMFVDKKEIDANLDPVTIVCDIPISDDC
jgi:phage terminase small subunit